jgi:GNAT superfamily N-acetyltransferase
VSISARVAGDADRATIAGLRRTWNEEHAGAAIDDDGFDTAFAAWWEAERASRTFFVVEVDGIVVGMANVKRYDRMPVAGRASGGCWGYVGNVFVRRDHRGTGAGRAIMEAVIAWAWAAGMEHLRLAPSDEAKPLYDRLGFVAGSVVELNPPST